MFKKVPHTYVIVFAIIVIAAILTWIIPSGEFDRMQKQLPNGDSTTVIVENSYHEVEANPQTWQIFTSIFDGFKKQAGIIAFILLVGGSFWILNESKALAVGINSFLKISQRLERHKFLQKIGVNNIIIVLIMTMFSAFGAIFGMSEETIAFVVIFVPLAISMGYDSITGLCMVYVAAHLGFAGAIFNPFTIGIAQGMADLPLFSGWEYRFVCWLVINLVGFAFILWYASRVKKNPQKSLTYQIDEYWRKNNETHSDNIEYYTPKSAWLSYVLVSVAVILFSIFYSTSNLKVGNAEFNFAAVPIVSILFIVSSFFLLRKSVHFYIINLLLFTILYLIIGVMGYGWYVEEIGGLFLAMGLAAGIAMNKSANDIVKMFLDGAKDIFSAAFVVGLAGGIIAILTNGHIIDTIMNGLAGGMQDNSKEASLSIMYGIQTFLNIIIPSGSAKAALTMPIMAPFSDLVEISRQTTVLAFQFGDGFTNMITPTSGVLIGALGMAKIPYDKWFKFIWKFMLVLIVLGFLLTLPTLYLSLNGF